MKNQSGSAHVIIIVILSIALVGVLGFVFWKNVTKDSDKSAVANTSDSSKTEQVSSQAEAPANPAANLVNKDLMTSDNVAISYKMPSTWTGGSYGGGDTISDEESTTLSAPDGFKINMTISRLVRGWSPEDPMAIVLDVQKSSGTMLTWVVVDHANGTSGPICLQVANQEIPKVGEQKIAGSSIHKLGEAEGAGVYLEIYGGYDKDMSLESFNSKDSVKQAKLIIESIKAGL